MACVAPTWAAEGGRGGAWSEGLQTPLRKCVNMQNGCRGRNGEGVGGRRGRIGRKDERTCERREHVEDALT